MTANPWLITIHLIALFIWLAHLMVTPRVMAYMADQPDAARESLARWLKRSWNLSSPAGLVVLAVGLMMLHGVGMPGADPATTLGTYLSPRQVNGLPTWDGDPSYWYITFHVKLVSALLLIFCDFWLGAQIYRIARNEPARGSWGLPTLLGIGFALVANLLVWLALASLGVGPASRFIGYAGAIGGLVGGIMAGRKLGRGDTRAKYNAFHGLVAALMVLIVILIIARPLAYGGHTLG
ncbi:MAG: hypothetical protein KDB90_01200 [Planctomycetes bacterium]|nr:hypothetical protein [Planctomycetota bacterium]